MGALECWAVTHPGLEAVTAAELSAMGIAPGAAEPGGLTFHTGTAGLYAANLRLRTASRVLLRIAAFHARSFAELERHAAKLPWGDFVAPGAGVWFHVSSRKSKLYHQRAVAERVAAALDRAVPGGAGASGAERFHVRLHRDQCTVSVDASGELLHRRGYRQALAKAPLRETLAAAMLLAAGWDGSVPLLDPLAGSGTIGIEGALIARRIAPGLGRGFAFEEWPSFDRSAWRDTREAAEAERLEGAAAAILCSDRDPGAVSAAEANAARAGVAGDVTIRRAALSAIVPGDAPGLVATNPPWGVRVGERKRLRDLYAQLGHVLRRACPGWDLVMLSPHQELERQVGLDFRTLAATTSGGVPVRLQAARVPGNGAAHR